MPTKYIKQCQQRFSFEWLREFAGSCPTNPAGRHPRNQLRDDGGKQIDPAHGWGSVHYRLEVNGEEIRRAKTGGDGKGHDETAAPHHSLPDHPQRDDGIAALLVFGPEKDEDNEAATAKQTDYHAAVPPELITTELHSHEENCNRRRQEQEADIVHLMSDEAA